MSEISKESKILLSNNVDLNVLRSLLIDVATKFDYLVDEKSEYVTLRNTITFEAEQQFVARFLKHLQEVKLGKLNGIE